MLSGSYQISIYRTYYYHDSHRAIVKHKNVWILTLIQGKKFYLPNLWFPTWFSDDVFFVCPKTFLREMRAGDTQDVINELLSFQANCMYTNYVNVIIWSILLILWTNKLITKDKNVHAFRVTEKQKFWWKRKLMIYSDLDINDRFNELVWINDITHKLFTELSVNLESNIRFSDIVEWFRVGLPNFLTQIFLLKHHHTTELLRNDWVLCSSLTGCNTTVPGCMVYRKRFTD